ncbi:hypothetical protein [Burkholderia sp. GS2Y]|uniref:Uncharacterized protein n=1 Tax=Burkholderia theae TaxID=3143496 RepID=A0ABU9WPM0_9BURK
MDNRHANRFETLCILPVSVRPNRKLGADSGRSGSGQVYPNTSVSDWTGDRRSHVFHDVIACRKSIECLAVGGELHVDNPHINQSNSCALNG